MIHNHEAETTIATALRQRRNIAKALKSIQTSPQPTGAPGHLLRLQRKYGNRHVQHLLMKFHVADMRPQSGASTLPLHRADTAWRRTQKSGRNGALRRVMVRQRNNSTLVQRLIRTPYPWQGVITPAIGARIRSSPDSSSPGNVIDSIPQGQRVDRKSVV